MRRALLTTALAVLAPAALVACGEDGTDEDDAALASSLIEHHAAGIELANTTIGRDGLDPRVAELAETIRVDGTADIDALATLVKERGGKPPRTGFGTGDGHTPHEDGHGDLESLAAEGDDAFARAWLTRMIAHHEDGLVLAGEADEDGGSELADLVDDTVAAQETELERMRAWLDET